MIAEKPAVKESAGNKTASFFGNLNLQGHDILDVGKIAGMFGRWSIDGEGKLIANENGVRYSFLSICSTTFTVTWKAGN